MCSSDLIVWIVRTIVLENKKWFWVIYANSNTFYVESFFRFESMLKVLVHAFFEFKMAQLLIVWIVRIIILENKKCFWVIYSNSNTFHVESFFRFESMQKLFKFIFKKNSNSYQI